jgi:hypothetical protein
MSSSRIPSLLLQSLYVVGLGAEPCLGPGEVLGGRSGGLSSQGDLDIEGLSISQGKEVDRRHGVDRVCVDALKSLVVELRGGGGGVGSRSAVHADLEVFGGGSRDWDSMFDFKVDIDGRRGGLGVGGHESEVELMLTLLLDVFLLSFRGCVWWY